MSESWTTKLKIPRSFFTDGPTLLLNGESVSVSHDTDSQSSAICLKDTLGRHLWVYFVFKAGDDGFVSMFDRTFSNMGAEWMVPAIKKAWKKSIMPEHT